LSVALMMSCSLRKENITSYIQAMAWES